MPASWDFVQIYDPLFYNVPLFSVVATSHWWIQGEGRGGGASEPPIRSEGLFAFTIIHIP